MNLNDLALEIEQRTGIKPNLTKRIFKETGSIIQDRVPKGDPVSIPNVVRIAYGYSPPRKKGDVVTGPFGERTVEKNEPEKLRVLVGYPGGKKKLLPRKGTKGYKTAVESKAK